MKFDLNPEVGREKFEFTLNIYNGYNNYKICEDFKKVKKVLLDLYNFSNLINLPSTSLKSQVDGFTISGILYRSFKHS
jgi:hypothetical protein